MKKVCDIDTLRAQQQARFDAVFAIAEQYGVPVKRELLSYQGNPEEFARRLYIPVSMEKAFGAEMSDAEIKTLNARIDAYNRHCREF